MMVKDILTAVEKAGFTWRRCSEYHWQILGGAVVNVFEGKRGIKVHPQFAKVAFCPKSVQEVVAVAYGVDAPTSKAKRKPSRRDRKRMAVAVRESVKRADGMGKEVDAMNRAYQAIADDAPFDFD